VGACGGVDGETAPMVLPIEMVSEGQQGRLLGIASRTPAASTFLSGIANSETLSGGGGVFHHRTEERDFEER